MNRPAPFSVDLTVRGHLTAEQREAARHALHNALMAASVRLGNQEPEVVTMQTFLITFEEA